MGDTTIYTLGASTLKGMYCLLTNPLLDTTGPNLVGGTRIAIELGGQFIPGRVAHSTFRYVSDYWIEQRRLRGCYFIADAPASDGSESICGLCLGMRVRLLQ